MQNEKTENCRYKTNYESKSKRQGKSEIKGQRMKTKGRIWIRGKKKYNKA
jgi:hypothetical protein